MFNGTRDLGNRVLFKALKRWRVALFTFVVVSLVGLTLLPQFNRLKFIYGVEQTALSLRFQQRGVEAPQNDDTKIIIIGVDDTSLNPLLSQEDLLKNPEAAILQQPFPWNRSIYKFVADRLINAGAKVVAFDFVFAGPNDGDWEFYDAIVAHPNQIVLGYDYTFSENEIGETLVQERLPYDDLLPIDLSNLLGFVNIHRDDDGVLRRAKLVTNIFAENQRFIDDPVQNARVTQLAEREENMLSFGAQAAALVKPAVKNTLPPLFEFPVINYGGLSYFPTVSFIDLVLEDRFNSQKSVFKDAIVMVGPYSDFFKDVMSTPFGDMYGIETHAHVARSLLNDSFYQTLSFGQNLATLFIAAGLVLIGNLVFKSALRKAAWILTLLIAYSILSQIAFIHAGHIFPFVSIFTIIAFGGALLLVFDFTISQYERLRLRGYLSRYVSPEIADLLAEDSAELETLLRGANRTIAVMFSDIRGFTTLSEQYSPEALVAHLNDYFESMVDSIHLHQGSLNKYIGDAILAFWGGIYSAGSQQDCVNAVKTALDMGTRMEALNAEWAKLPGRVPLKVGVGISYGTAFVGNLGHSHRMEFAVMGDVVNLGSRLEGATKQYGCAVLVSEKVYQNCCEAFHFQEMDCIQVKGKTEGVRVYSPVGAKEDPEPDWLDDWRNALASYRSRQFRSAFTLFEALAARESSQAIAAKLYLERCLELEQDPPPENWNYVFIMGTK